MKLILGTEQQLTDLQAEQFTLGAPFSCYLKGDAWNEATLTVGKNTTAWQSVQYSESLGSHYIVHIDEFDFSTYTFQDYHNMLPVLPEEYPEGETEADYLNPVELAIKQRIEAIAPELWSLTPQQYVSQEIIGSNYTIVEV